MTPFQVEEALRSGDLYSAKIAVCGRLSSSPLRRRGNRISKWLRSVFLLGRNPILTEPEELYCARLAADSILLACIENVDLDSIHSKFQIDLPLKWRSDSRTASQLRLLIACSETGGISPNVISRLATSALDIWDTAASQLNSVSPIEFDILANILMAVGLHELELRARLRSCERTSFEQRRFFPAQSMDSLLGLGDCYLQLDDLVHARSVYQEVIQDFHWVADTSRDCVEEDRECSIRQLRHAIERYVSLASEETRIQAIPNLSEILEVLERTEGCDSNSQGD